MTQGATDARPCSLRARELVGIYGQGGRVHKPGRDASSHDWLLESSSLGSPDF
jgi:hypothetical protein